MTHQFRTFCVLWHAITIAAMTDDPPHAIGTREWIWDCDDGFVFRDDWGIAMSKPTHPAEVNMDLSRARCGVDRLIEGAEKRGDQKGADAWLIARNAIEAAEQAMREARMVQTWERKR